MNFDNISNLLISVLTSTALLAAIAYFLKDGFFLYLTKKIDLHQNEKLIKLENSLAQSSAEIADFRSVLVSQLVSRNDQLILRQIDAADNLWKHACNNNKRVMSVDVLNTINIEEMDKQIQQGDSSDFIELLSKIGGVDDLINEAKNAGINARSIQGASIERPHVSPLAWSLYSAHSAVISHAVMTLLTWKHGYSSTKYLRNKKMVSTVQAALPHQKVFLNKHGVTGAFTLVEELEETLLEEIRRFLVEGTSSEDATNMANIILENSQAVLSEKLTHPSSTH